MATTAITATAPFGAITAHRLVSFVEATLTGFADRRAERRTKKALHALPDDILRDIGLTRSDIESAIR